ncbi:unnamed protein product [Adineta steineri]|uniref:Tetratricopeptide repeat protein n=1 Tax=Adineta steineri TaxID=433720 RepID=A0A815MXC2_9BILA|nr:unnamed protein product [Adineta steineri]CAF3951403.1 unnamed protein product [Adineta steineri]
MLNNETLRAIDLPNGVRTGAKIADDCFEITIGKCISAVYYGPKNCDGNPLLTDTYKVLANINLTKDDYDQALIYYYKSLANLFEKKSLQSSSIANNYKTMGYIYFHQKNMEDALLFFNRFIDCQMQKHSIQHPSIVDVYTMIEKIYSIKHLYNHSGGAANHLAKLLSTQINEDPSTKKLLEDTYKMINGKTFKARYTDQSLNYFKKLHRQQIKTKTANDNYYLIIANIYLEKHDYNQAILYFERSVGNNSSKNISLADIYAIMANIYCKLGHFNQGIVHYETALSIYKKYSPSTDLKIEKVKQDISNVITQLQI